MKYLLDTCTISHFIKGHPSISAQLKACPPELLCVSSITVMEIEYGLRLNLQRARLINPILETLFSCIHLLPFETKEALTAGSIRAELKKQDQPIGPFDLLIAAQALEKGLVLVTQNTKEFARISGLALEDWQ